MPSKLAPNNESMKSLSRRFFGNPVLPKEHCKNTFLILFFDLDFLILLNASNFQVLLILMKTERLSHGHQIPSPRHLLLGSSQFLVNVGILNDLDINMSVLTFVHQPVRCKSQTVARQRNCFYLDQLLLYLRYPKAVVGSAAPESRQWRCYSCMEAFRSMPGFYHHAVIETSLMYSNILLVRPSVRPSICPSVRYDSYLADCQSLLENFFLKNYYPMQSCFLKNILKRPDSIVSVQLNVHL